MAEDFYPFVDSGDPAPDNSHLTGGSATHSAGTAEALAPHGGQNGQTEPETGVNYATRISVYDDMLSTPRIIVIEQQDVRTYLEEITNTVYRVMKEQGGRLSLMVIRELVENFIHAHFTEPVISILDGGNTIRFADQGPGIADKERAFEFGVTSADREQKRYIRGTGAGLPMVQQYLENAGGTVSIEDNLNQGTVVTVSVDPARAEELNRTVSRGAAVRGAAAVAAPPMPAAVPQAAVAGMPNAYGAQPAQMMPGAYGMPMGYQPYGAQFSTVPQQAMQPAGSYPQTAMGMPIQQMQPLPQAQQAMPQQVPQQAPYVSERGTLALQFLFENTLGGPTDLAGRFTGSPATWSRELGILADTGLVIKHGKKYMLTEMGKVWVQQA